MPKRFLTESYEAFGRWQKLGDDTATLPGQLRFDPVSGLSLTLVGHFGGAVAALGDMEDDSSCVLLGTTSDVPITLYQCRKSGTAIRFPGEGSTTYRAGFAVIGGHDDGSGEFVTSRVTARIPLLDAWVPVSGLQTTIEQTADDQLSRFSNSYSPAQELSINFSWGEIQISPAASLLGATTTVNREARIVEWLDITIELNEEESFGDVLNNRVGPLVDLATLLTSYPAEPTYVGLVIPRSDDSGATDGGSVTLDVLYQAANATAPAVDRVDWSRFLVPPTDTRTPSFEVLAQRWFECRGRFKRSMDMLFGMERSPRGTFTEVRFLTLCHAAEAMHRDQPLPQHRWTSARYKEIQTAAIDAVDDPETQAVLKAQLRFANDVTLRERLIALRDQSIGPSSDLVSDEAVARIVRARNRLTHSSTSELRGLEATEDLYYLTKCVLWILRCGFLSALGFSPEETGALVRQNREFQWLAEAYLSKVE